MICYLSLGSNRGDRERLLRTALERIAAVPGVELLRASSVYESDPWGGVGQGPFLNMVAEVETDLDPLDLLEHTQAIEIGLGRVRGQRWGPRVMDIDLLLCGELQVQQERLIVPHPLIEQRQFVLVPLAELVPELELPSGRSAGELACPQSDELRRWAPPLRW